MSRAALLVVVAACQDSITTPFPEGLEPFDDGPEAAALDAPVAEALVTRSTNDDFIRIYGRGYVFASPAAVYASARDPEVMIAACSTSSQVITPGTEPQYELSFLVHYFVNDILNVEWDDQWRGSTVTGTLEAPELVALKHQKIEGSDFITVSEGTVTIFATADPGITELQFVEHLDAVSASTADVLEGMQHNYDALVASGHGLGVPPCP
ncbi:MAG: hypothetical protein ABI867_15175 [Kofleriaceae bacterium]